MAAFNGNFKYVLNIVESFSKWLWSIPLKSKKSSKIAEEFETVFKKEKPHVLQSDNGKEFKNGDLARVCANYGIKQVFATAYKPSSSGQVERTNRTLKQMIFAHMTAHKTRQWIDVHPMLVNNYNTSYHSTIKMAPMQLHNRRRTDPIVKKVNARLKARGKEWIKEKVSTRFHDKSTYSKLRKGDWVLILRHKLEEGAKNTIFEKKFVRKWSHGFYQIVSVSKPATHRQVYRVRAEASQEPLATHFFRSDLQKVDKNKLIPNQKKQTETMQINEATGEARPVFDRELHLERLHEQRRATRGMPRVKPNPAESIAATREKRVVKKPKKLDL